MFSIDIYHIWFNVFIPRHLGVNQCKDVDVWILDVGHGVKDAKKAEIQYVSIDDSPGEETRGSETSYSEHIVIEQPEDGFQYLRDKMSGFLLAFKSKATVSKYSSYFNRWKFFISEKGHNYLPAKGIHVALFLVHFEFCIFYKMVSQFKWFVRSNNTSSCVKFARNQQTSL